MPKRRRLFTPLKNRTKNPTLLKDSDASEDVSTARGRLKGALMDVLGPGSEDSDASSDYIPDKRQNRDRNLSDDEDLMDNRQQRQSYVLKLFDRSVDLSQFKENSPLYPICRAWITNQPKSNYKEIRLSREEPRPSVDSVELPGPDGPPISKIPALLPEQLKADKNNINLNYREAPPPSREQLLQWHGVRWAAVRAAWLQQAARSEARYAATHQLLSKINVNAM